MAYKTTPIWNSMRNNISRFKKKIIRDVLLSVLLIKIAGFLTTTMTVNFEVPLFILYISTWSFLYSRYTSMIFSGTANQSLLAGVILLLILSAVPIVIDAMINNETINSLITVVMKMAASGIVMSIFLALVYPVVIKLTIPRKHRVYRSGMPYNKPFFMIPSFFLAICSFLFGFKLLKYFNMLCENAGGKLFFGIALDALFFFSAIFLASLLFAMYKKGYEGG